MSATEIDQLDVNIIKLIETVRSDTSYTINSFLTFLMIIYMKEEIFYDVNPETL